MLRLRSARQQLYQVSEKKVILYNVIHLYVVTLVHRSDKDSVDFCVHFIGFIIPLKSKECTLAVMGFVFVLGGFLKDLG